MQKIHHCPLCNYDIKLFQKGITRKITNAPKQPKIKIPNQRRKLHEILLQKIPCFYANYLYTIFLSTGLAPVPPYKFCRTRARPIPTIPPSFLPCFLPSMLPSFHASFLPCFLPSFPASFLPSFLFFYKCKWQMYVRFDANLWFFLLMPLPGKKVWPASHSLGIVSLAC